MTIKLPAAAVSPASGPAEHTDRAGARLTDLVDRDLLESQAGWLTYMRGVDYAAAYDKVVRLLTTMRPLYTATDGNDAFAALVASIRTSCKRRRNLITRLDRARL